jgi:hypothetical protein
MDNFKFVTAKQAKNLYEYKNTKDILIYLIYCDLLAYELVLIMQIKLHAFWR